ncbi:MAG: cytoplasmic protein [Desulfuromonas sp.]|nr:MAG: cytoplasmic protein [Desulfuromonas sp.]
MDRRQFIRNSLQAAIMAAAAGSLPMLELVPVAQAAGGPDLAVRKGTDIPLLVRETLSALGGMDRFVKSGETVVVKPNIGWDRSVELAANTHPEVVKAVVQLCLEAGAKEVRIFDRTCNDARRCYVNSGIRDALESIRSDRVSLEHMDRRAYQEVALKGGVALDEWSFYKPALEADRFINVPIAKHHSISRLTLAMKNVMGVIGGNRGALHRRIDESLADINSVIHSDLTIVDATRILVANGPQGGRLSDVRQLQTLIASPDIIAADSYAATLFGLEPGEISTIVAGARRGLGTMDLSRVNKV